MSNEQDDEVNIAIGSDTRGDDRKFKTGNIKVNT
jgi:hypothetical protein